ncbi:hypothetical protein ABBQ32_006464 [Trebouxia sp. C0010 RCD-2024]
MENHLHFRRTAASGASTRLLAFVLASLLITAQSAISKSAVLPIKRRDGGLLSRDLLQNATIPLHGAVRDYGYFYANLQLGTPPKNFQVIVDTGSTITYVPCSQCGDQCGSHHADAAFDLHVSSSAEEIFCGDPRCQCGNPTCSCGPQNQCQYIRNYAEHSSSAGGLVQDNLQLLDGGFPVVFGCETRETGEIFSQEADGIMGLGNSPVSVMNQLARAGTIEDVFSICFGGVEGNGALMLGDVSPATFNVSLHYTPLLATSAHPHYYVARLEGVAVDGSILPVDQGLYDIGHGTVLDSGTTFTYLPSQAYEQLRTHVSSYALAHGLHTVPGPDPHFQDNCFGGAPPVDQTAQLQEVFPSLELRFEGSAVSIPPINYLFMHTREANAYCLGVFNYGNSGTLIGGITFRDTLVQYDRRNNRVGFGPAPCQHIGTGELVLDPCDPSLLEEARAMLPACAATSSPIPVVPLVEPQLKPSGLRPGQEDEVLESEVSEDDSPGAAAGASTTAAVFSTKGAIAGLVTAGGVVIVVYAAAMVATKTSFIQLVKEQWNMQPYESVDPEQSVNSINTIQLRDIKVDNEATSEASSSARSRSPGRTQGFM